MKTYFLDFETFYSKEYSLRHMTPVEYILDPRFEAIGCAVKEDLTGTPYWVDGPDLPAFFKQLPPKVMTVTHNALFDNCVMAWRFDYVPELIVDTLSVSRAVLGQKLRSLSLASVAAHLGLGVKGDTVLKVMGMSRAAIIQAGLYEEYKSYSVQDVELCAGIYDKLVRSGGFPVRELFVADMVLRCAIEPMFQLDQTVLAEHLNALRQEKDLLLTHACMVGAGGKDDLMSNDKFAALLRDLGVEPPMKKSPVTGRQSYAFAKTDAAFIELQEHENPGVQALVAARLGHKSTLAESRAERMMAISNLAWPVTRKGNAQRLMPVPLRYSGATQTHRLSGDWKLNLQNLPTRGGSNELRRALTAPDGYVVFAIDASQIEARIVAWLCDQQDLVDAFARGDDVYSLFAAEIFEKPVTKADKVERFIGKTCILGLGYGVGWIKLQNTIKLGAKAQLGQALDVQDTDAQKYVNTYRTKYHRIPETWRSLNYEGIPALAGMGQYSIGPCHFSAGEIVGPSGLKLYYPDLKQVNNEWQFTSAGKPKRIYGGALLENIVQHLARVVVMDAALRIRQRFARFNLQVHDELVYVVKREDVPTLQAIALEEMSRRPAWAPELPLAAECGVGQNYGDAK